MHVKGMFCEVRPRAFAFGCCQVSVCVLGQVKLLCDPEEQLFQSNALFS